MVLFRCWELSDGEQTANRSVLKGKEGLGTNSHGKNKMIITFSNRVKRQKKTMALKKARAGVVTKTAIQFLSYYRWVTSSLYAS